MTDKPNSDEWSLAKMYRLSAADEDADIAAQIRAH